MRNIQTFLLAVFSLACVTSMAGMEISGWLLVALALVTLVIHPETRKILIQPPLLAAYGLALWAGISIFWNQDHIKSPWTTFGDLRWALSVTGLSLSFAVVMRNIDNKRMETWIWILTAVATLISIYSISQYWTGADWLRGPRSPLLLIEESKLTGVPRYRPYGLFRMTLTYACSFAMFGLIPFSLSFFYRKTEPRKFWLLMGASLLIFLSVFMTFSRGVWISLGVALVFALWFLSRRFLIWLPLIGASLAAIALVCSPVLRERVASFSNMKHESNSARLNLWQANFLMFKTHPLVGVGYQQNGPEALDPYYQQLGILSEFKSHAHNNYLNMLSGTGLPGFLFFMLFIGTAMLLTWRNFKRFGPNERLHYLVLASLAAQIVMLVGGLTEYNFGDSEVQYQFLGYVAFNVGLFSQT